MRSIIRVLIMGIVFILANGCSLLDINPKDVDPAEEKVKEKDKESNQKLEPVELKKGFTPTIKVETLWKKRFGGGLDEHYLKLRPSITGENLFISDREGQLITVELASGKVRWKIKDNDVEYTSPAGVGDSMVLVGTGDGRLIARDIEDGSLKWIARTSSEVLAAPTAHDGITIVRSADGSLLALDSKTGAEIWNYRRESPRLTLRGNSRPLIDDGVLFSALDNGRLLALDLKVGTSIWNKAITVPSGVTDLERMVDLDGDPVITDDFIYVSSFQGGVTALSKVDGQIIWARQISSYSGLARGDDKIYVADENSVIWALNEDDGISVWKLNELERRFVTDPVFFKNYLIVGDLEGYVHWISAKTGEIVFRIRLDRKSLIAPAAVSDNVVVIRSSSGRTIAMTLID